MQRSRWILGALVLSAATAFGQGTILWDEAVNGPLSNDYTVATAFGELGNGTNSVSGASQVIGNGVWGDYFTIVVPNSRVVSALWISADNQVEVWIGNTAYSIEYGYVLRPANGNVLPQWSFDPINAGAYGLYVTDYDFSDNHTVSNYRLDFVVEAIPEPASLWLLLGGLGWLGFRGWRKSHPGKAVTLVLALSAAPAFGQGTILWNEAVNGPLSNNGFNPTPLGTLGSGTNSIFGVTEYVSSGSGGTLYGDYFTFAIPEGSEINGLPFATDKLLLVWLGNTSFSVTSSHTFNPANGDLLPQLALPSIAAGAYGMYIELNDFSSSAAANYRLDFVVQAIPEPASPWLLLGGLSWLGFRSWRNARD